MDDLIARLTAAIDETETAARAALAGYAPYTGGYDGCEPAIMSSVWQAAYHEVLQVMTEEPSAAFIARHVPGASVERMKRRKVADCGPANVYPAQHIARHDPASVLRGCAADRKLIEDHAEARAAYKKAEGETELGSERRAATAAVFLVYEAVLKRVAERYGLEVRIG